MDTSPSPDQREHTSETFSHFKLLLLKNRDSRTKAALVAFEEAIDSTPDLQAIFTDDSSASPIGDLLRVVEDLSRDWSDDELGELFETMTERVRTGRPFAVADLARWMGAHPPDHRAWAAWCLRVHPPEQVGIVRVLSVAGAQKVVYEARWDVADRRIVLKDFVEETAARAIILRELEPHPLSMEHPNIIETHRLTNSENRPFLVERFLLTLNDEDWQDPGAVETANLLHDMASALQFVHERRRIHGDVKPDNIGYERRRYLLLDFGVSRRMESTAKPPIGSLRTRSPELLLDPAASSTASDVWALGATVFHGMVGRFPFYAVGETTPKDGEPGREKLEADVRARAEDEAWWDEHIFRALSSYPHRALASLVEAALSRDPNRRPSAKALATSVRDDLASLVRAIDGPVAPSVGERVRQLGELRKLPEQTPVPARARKDLEIELQELSTFPGLSEEDRRTIAELTAQISGPLG